MIALDLGLYNLKIKGKAGGCTFFLDRAVNTALAAVGACGHLLARREVEGVHDVYLHQGNLNGDSFSCFVQKCLLPILSTCIIPGQL